MLTDATDVPTPFLGTDLVPLKVAIPGPAISVGPHAANLASAIPNLALRCESCEEEV